MFRSLHAKAAPIFLIGSLAACDVNVTQTTPAAETAAPTTEVTVPATPSGVASAPANTPTAAVPSMPTVAPENTHQASASSPLVGSWSSPSCGDRKYVRTLRFADKGAFSAQDLVSPCPPNAKCVWSGIVDRKGTYVVSGNQVKLAVDGPAKGPAVLFPETLELAPGPTEKQGGASCSYARQGL